MTDERCNCSMTISVLGDGCRYCQPQEYIDRLLDEIEDIGISVLEANDRE